MPTYTVSFSTGTGNPTQAAIKETTGGAGVTLPAGPTPTCTDWDFAGWAETSVTETTTTPEVEESTTVVVEHSLGTTEVPKNPEKVFFPVITQWSSYTVSVATLPFKLNKASWIMKNNPRCFLLLLLQVTAELRYLFADIVKGSFAKDLRYLSFYSSDSDVVRVTGYLAKRSEIEKLKAGNAVLQDTTMLAKDAFVNAHIPDRKVR